MYEKIGERRLGHASSVKRRYGGSQQERSQAENHIGCLGEIHLRCFRNVHGPGPGFVNVV